MEGRGGEGGKVRRGRGGRERESVRGTSANATTITTQEGEGGAWWKPIVQVRTDVILN
jgi:hypothetical protein